MLRRLKDPGQLTNAIWRSTCLAGMCRALQDDTVTKWWIFKGCISLTTGLDASLPPRPNFGYGMRTGIQMGTKGNTSIPKHGVCGLANHS